ncbi:MAG: DUF748 domain-containing protein [Chryseolinea sp.]
MAWVIAIVLILIMAAFMLPFITKAILNHALHKMDGYTGRIDQLRMNLLKSKISFQNVSILKDSDPASGKPLVQVPTITLFFKWKQLLRRTLDLNIVVDKPQLFFVAEKPSYDANHSPELSSLKNSIERLMPFKISVDVHNGEIHYINSHPQLNIMATEFSLTIHDFSNRLILGKSCSIVGTCFLYEGNAKINATLLPLEPTLTVDLNLELKSINLVLLNDLFREYGKVDINKGTLDLYTEVAVTNNLFKGYIKPLLKNLDFISAADQGDTFFQKIWERIVAGFYNMVENNRNDQVATKIPIEGRLDDPNVRIGVAIIGILRNAFVKALTPSLDNVINFKSIWDMARSETKGVLKAIFNK